MNEYMEYLEIVLWFVALYHVVAGAYYDLFKDDDAKVMRHEVGAILMLSLIVAGSV